MQYGCILPRALAAPYKLLTSSSSFRSTALCLYPRPKHKPLFYVSTNPSARFYSQANSVKHIGKRRVWKKNKPNELLRKRNVKAASEFDELLYRHDFSAALNIPLKSLSTEQLQKFIEWLKNEINKELHGETEEKLLVALNSVSSAMVEGKIEFDPRNLEKILHCLRRLRQHEAAYKLWLWARQAGKPLTLGVYSAAIQILTDDAIKIDLEELETIYEEAIANDGGPFAEYYLKHNAIESDRTKGSIGSHIQPRTMHLLAAIARARLVHGNWQDGYLAYDSACRLNPSRPRLFYQGMISTDSRRSAPEMYRIAQAAAQEDVEINIASVSHVVRHILHPTEAMSRDLRNNEQFLIIIRLVASCLDLMMSQIHLHLSQQPNKHIGLYPALTSILSVLLNLTDREKMSSVASHPDWEAYITAIAQVGIDFLKAVTPFLQGKVDQSRLIAMRLAINAGNSDTFQGLLKESFKQGASPDENVAQVLVEAAGRFGSLDDIKAAWQELAQIREDDHDKMQFWDLSALRSAALWNKSHDAMVFLRRNCKRAQLASLGNLPEQSDKETKSHSSADLTGAQCLIEGIFTKACTDLNSISPHQTTSPSDKKLLNINQKSLSLKHQPLAPLAHLWKIYDEISIDNSTKHQQSTISFSDLDQHPGLKRRFSDWVSVTELMADAEQYASLSHFKSGQYENFLEDEKDGRARRGEAATFISFLREGMGEVVKLDSLENSPRFTDFDKLKGYIWKLRKLDELEMPGV